MTMLHSSKKGVSTVGVIAIPIGTEIGFAKRQVAVAPDPRTSGANNGRLSEN